jgi:hypothetical protein
MHMQLVVYVDPASCAVTSALQPYLLITYTNATDNETYAYSNEKIYGYSMTGERLAVVGTQPHLCFLGAETNTSLSLCASIIVQLSSDTHVI